MPATKEETLNLRTKILISGVGALIPLGANLWVVDAALLFQQFTWLTFAAYMVKASVMFGTGCLLGFVNRTETKLVNLLALGLSVPSLFVGIVNGANVKASITPPSKQTGGNPTGRLFFGIRTVYASSGADTQPKVFSAPAGSTMDQIYQGLGIVRDYRGYFVIAGAYSNKGDAEKAVALIRQMSKDFNPVVYAPMGGSTTYSVAIGEQNTSQEALGIQNAAIHAGLQHAFVWRFAPGAPPIPPTQIGACAPAATDSFSLDEQTIHQTSFESTLYVYAKAVHDTRHVTSVYVLSATKGAYPPSGAVKDFEKNDKSESLKKADLRDGQSFDYTSPDGRTFRIAVVKTYHVKSTADRADLKACLVL
jgi:hypothetical protein